MVDDRAYLAGYFDGDGAVMLRPFSGKTSTYLLTAQVGSSSEAQCRFFEALYGGSVRRCKHSYLRRDGSLTTYFEWRATQQKAEGALRALRPFLRLKAAHADLALEYRGRVGKRGQVVSPAEATARAGLYAGVRELNARGAGAPLRRLPVPSEAEGLEYLAGLFDAEGTVTWVNDKERTVPLLHVGVVNTTDLACLMFAVRFGGQVNHIHRAGRGIFSWYLRQRKALPVLQALLPYLREKRHAAEVALATGIHPARRRPDALRQETSR